MKKYLLLLACSSSLCVNAQSVHKKPAKKPAVKSVKTPKDKGFEMKQYYFVMLVRNKDRPVITDTAQLNKLQEGHLANIGRLAEEGKIIVAGPFGDDGNWRGIFIFDCKTQQEVEELLDSDPMIKAGRLNYKIHPWWTAKNCVFK